MSVAVRGSEAQPTLIKPSAVMVQQGKILDCIDGVTQRNEPPEEYVRQEIAKSLVRECGYEKAEISVEFTLRLGSRKPCADLVIFDAGDPHDQDRAQKIIICKIHDERSSDEIEVCATSNERHDLNGRVKAKNRLDSRFRETRPRRAAPVAIRVSGRAP